MDLGNVGTPNGGGEGEGAGRGTGRLTRRRFLGRTLAAGAAFSLTGLAAACGGSEEAGASEAPETTGQATTQAPETTAETAPARGGSLRWITNGGSPTDVLDPAKGGAAMPGVMHIILYDRLTGTGPNWEVFPRLAQDWEGSSDATTWTFRLVDGATFHDGKPVTSADVAYSLVRVLDPELGSPGTASLDGFLRPNGIEVGDPTTITFKLDQPNGFFPTIVAQSYLSIVPDGTTDFSRPVGSGLFVFEAFEPGAFGQFTRNPNYWITDRPLVDEFEIRNVPEAAAKLQAVISGDAHIADNVPLTDQAEIKRSGSALLVPVADSAFVNLAARTDQQPFTDPRVIQALKHAADRSVLMGIVAPEGLGTVGADVPVPAGDPFYPEGLEPVPFDPERARSLLGEAGFRDGVDLELTGFDGSPGHTMAIAFKDLAAESGFRINIKTVPEANFWESHWLKNKFISDYWARFHITAFLQNAFGCDGTWNETHFCNPTVDGLTKDGIRSIDSADQQRYFQEALMIIGETAGHYQPGWYPYSVVTAKNVSGVNIGAGGLTTLDPTDIAIA